MLVKPLEFEVLYLVTEKINVVKKNIARIANAVQVTICLLVSTNVY